MGVAENMALERRVVKLEREMGLAIEPVRIRTYFRVYIRGREPRCLTIADVHAAKTLDPVVDLIETRLDLDMVIEAQSGCHMRRRRGDDPEYDELVADMRTIDVPISCYPEQLEQILSDAPITATVGGTRAGKTRVLVWWLFRQWLIRGHGVDEDHEIEARFWWVREDSTKLWDHAVQWISRLWPDEVFTGRLPSKSQIAKVHHLIDGSSLHYKHAAHSGGRAGTSLRSESVEALVCDELSAVHDQENWREMKSRVGQTGGPIAVAFTPTAGHWSAALTEGNEDSGDTIVVSKLVMWDNPWWPWARIWVDLLKDRAITATQLEERILPADNMAVAALAEVKDPHVRRMRFGEQSPVGIILWREWSSAYTVDTEYLVVDGKRLPEVTAAVCGPLFDCRPSWFGGTDFNVNPGVTLAMRAFGDPTCPHILVVDEVATTGPTIRAAAAVAKRYPGMATHCDPTGAMGYRHQSHGDKSMSDAEEMRRAGIECWPANGNEGLTPRHLPQLDSINVLHRAMHLGLLRVHQRCTGLLAALVGMRAMPDGRIAKVSGVRSASDQLSGYGDALRYGVWPVWQDLALAP